VEVIKQGNNKLLDFMRITYCDFGGNTAVRYSINDFGVGFPAKVSFRVNNMKGALKGLGAMQLQSSLKSGLINRYNLSWKHPKDHSKAFTTCFLP